MVGNVALNTFEFCIFLSIFISFVKLRFILVSREGEDSFSGQHVVFFNFLRYKL